MLDSWLLGLQALFLNRQKKPTANHTILNTTTDFGLLVQLHRHFEIYYCALLGKILSWMIDMFQNWLLDDIENHESRQSILMSILVQDIHRNAESIGKDFLGAHLVHCYESGNILGLKANTSHSSEKDRDERPPVTENDGIELLKVKVMNFSKHCSIIGWSEGMKTSWASEILWAGHAVQ